MNATQNIVRQMSRLLVVAGVSALALAATSPAHAQVVEGPANMAGSSIVIGKSYDYSVKGSLSGRVWGTDVYTDDSTLATVAVHAGLLRDGQQGVIRVTMLAGQTSYQGSTRNGVTSTDWGTRSRSYRVAAVSTGTTTTTTATGSFHAIWSTDWGVYLGLWQVGNQVTGYYWDGAWYPILTGTVTGRVLSGRWDAAFTDGTFTFTLAPDGRGFDAVAQGLDGFVTFTFKGGLYLNWN